jgi:hypothetical protein
MQPSPMAGVTECPRTVPVQSKCVSKTELPDSITELALPMGIHDI